MEENKVLDNLTERLEFRKSGENISILYRPVHTYISFVNNNDAGKEEIKRLCTLSREEFAKYLKTCTGLPAITNSLLENISRSDAEKWYNNAWKMQTENILKELGIENPVEEPILMSHINAVP